MTRFIYLADTHWGAGASGYHLQPKYDERLPELLVALRSWMEQAGPIDFVLHGGDLIHETSAAAIQSGAALFDLAVPVYLCLGNHDLTAAGSLDQWQRLAPQLFPGNPASYGIDADDCTIHVMPNQYGETPFLWDQTQDPHLLPEQTEALEERLAVRSNSTQLILTHSPVYAISPAQTGQSEPFHAPSALFTEAVSTLAQTHGVACVLGGHTHANMNKTVRSTQYITVSSFVETPFEFKLFEVDGKTLSMQTHNLREAIGFPTVYDWDSTFVQGRAKDRSFQKDLSQ
jgi:DNA repair exonuclease SbcCD nuclease subunit